MEEKILVEDGIAYSENGFICFGFYNEKTRTNKVSIKEGCRRIDDEAFANEFDLEEVTLPESLVEIGDFAFLDCDKLKEITIPGKVENIGQSAFSSCDSLEKVYFSNNKHLKTIHMFAFNRCEALQKIINLENTSLKIIGDSAFEDCLSLKEFHMPNTVTNLGYKAFIDCTSLEKVTLSKNLTSFEGYSFQDCTSLKEVYNLQYISNFSECDFEGCSSLEAVIISNDVDSIKCVDEYVFEIYTFRFCPGLTHIYLTGKFDESKVDEYRSIHKTSDYAKFINIENDTKLFIEAIKEAHPSLYESVKSNLEDELSEILTDEEIEMAIFNETKDLYF